jgi:hypothetical protein
MADRPSEKYYIEQTTDVAHILSLPCGKEWNDSGKKPLEIAIYIIESTASIGYKGMKMFALQRLSLFNCLDMDDFIGGSTICFMVYEYFCFWLGIDHEFNTPQIILETDRPNISNMKYINKLKTSGWHSYVLSMSSLNKLEDGLYRCDMAGDEGHSFVWIIHKGKLYYAGGYGGTCGLVSVEFDKNTYFIKFVKAMLDADEESYKYVFGINDNASNVGGFSYLKIIKDDKYVSTI